MISAYLDRIEEDMAVFLVGEAMKKVNFPVEYLPENINEGDYVQIAITPDEEENA